MNWDVVRSSEKQKDSSNSSFDPKHLQCVHGCSLLLVPWTHMAPSGKPLKQVTHHKLTLVRVCHVRKQMRHCEKVMSCCCIRLIFPFQFGCNEMRNCIIQTSAIFFVVVFSSPPAIKYNVSIAERRFNPRAILDNPSKMQLQNLTLLPREETCEHIYFHVMVRDLTAGKWICICIQINRLPTKNPFPVPFFPQMI